MIAEGGVDSTAINRLSATRNSRTAAVAATVASGGADAGFGLRAAAAEYRLAFVPQVRERYFLAVRAKDAESAPIVRLMDALQSPVFARIARPLAGYRTTAAGSIVSLEALG